MPEQDSIPRFCSPFRSISACLVVLVLTLGLAAYVGHRKNTADQIVLSEARLYTEGLLSFQEPQGWEPVAPEAPPEGLVVALGENGRSDGAARRLYVFRADPRPLSMPAGAAAEMISQMAGALAPGVPKDIKSLGPGAVGRLPGWSVVMALVSPFRPTVESHCLGCVALAPGGQAVGVLLMCDAPPKRRESRLLDRVCQTLVLQDARVVAEAGDLMSAAGIRFVPPPGAEFVVCDAGRDYMLRMLAQDETASWFLDLHRVPLLESRRIEEVVGDLARQYAPRSLAPPEVEHSDENGRSFVHTWVESSYPGAVPVLLCAAQVDPATALVMVGRCPHDGKADLLERCRSLARIAEVRGIGDLLDVPGARKAAAGWLAGLRADGLDHRLTDALCNDRRFLLRSPALILGMEDTSCRPTADTPPSYILRSRSERRAGRGARIRTTETVRLSRNADRHEIAMRVEAAGRELLRYEEARRDPSGPVHRRLQTGVRSLEDESPVDETYACEPVILLAAAEMSADPDAVPMAFTSVSSRTAGPAAWFLLPWGEQPLPGERSGRQLRAVRVIRDYNPAALTLLFEPDGRLAAVALDDGSWQEPADPEPADVRPEAPGRVRRGPATPASMPQRRESLAAMEGAI